MPTIGKTAALVTPTVVTPFFLALAVSIGGVTTALACALSGPTTALAAEETDGQALWIGKTAALPI